MKPLLATTVLGIHVSLACAAPAPPEVFDLTAIDAFIAATVKENRLPGVSVAIVKDGEVVLAKGYGRRSLADGQPVTAETMFAIGSITKQFTCACVLLLAEEGRLCVQDKVAKYFPELTRANDITLLDLMNHVSGYPDYYPLDFVDRRMLRPIEPDELLRQYAGGKLDFEPGSRYSYSNTGYILLGRIVEKVSGEAFGAFLARRILQPQGLTHTAYEPQTGDLRLAQGHTTFALSGPEPIAPEAGGWIGAAGAIYSTPSDLAKWNLALISGKVLRPESYQLMTSPRPLTNGKVSEYGCGLGVRVQGNRQVLAHNGAVSGFVAWSAMIPSTRSCVIMCCNQDGGLGAMPGQVFGLLLQDPANVPSIVGAPAVETVKDIIGAWQKGRVDRARFGEEFNVYLTEQRIAGAAPRLKSFGSPRQAEVLSANERGGMEVTTTRVTFRKGKLKVLMYRMPDGRIEQFFVYPD